MVAGQQDSATATKLCRELRRPRRPGRVMVDERNRNRV
jgi:hypothetical protein